MKRIALHLIDQSSATDGQVPVWSTSLRKWITGASVAAMSAGTGIAIDNTDPTHPVISSLLSLVAGSGIVINNTDPVHPVISAAVTSQLIPLTTEVGGVPDLIWDDDNQLVMTEAF